VIIECECPDDLIEGIWILESYFPASISIEIASKVDEVSRSIFSNCGKILIHHLLEDIDQISLPYSSELEHDISVKLYHVSSQFYITMVSLFSSCGFSCIMYHLPTISELRESLADCRVKVSLCLDSDIECI
jgi:plasmid replication initiation protein